MDIKDAALQTHQFIVRTDIFIERRSATNKKHLYDMTHKIITGEVTGEKAHRWLGWIQACICCGGGATLEEMKLVNKRA